VIVPVPALQPPKLFSHDHWTVTDAFSIGRPPSVTMPDNVAVGMPVVGVPTAVGATELTGATGSFPPQPATNVASETTADTKVQTFRILSAQSLR
jgi:hypothetical protein